MTQHEYVQATMNMIKKEPCADKLDLVEVQIAVENKVHNLILNNKILNVDIEHVCRVVAFHVLLLFGQIYTNIYLVPASIVTTILSLPIEGLGKYIGDRLTRTKTKNTMTKNVLPISIPPLSKDECLLAVNTHIRNFVDNTVAPKLATNLVIPFIGGALTGSLLAGLFIFLGYNIVYLSDQIFALDFIPINKNGFIPPKDIDIVAHNDGTVFFVYDGITSNIRQQDNIYAGFAAAIKPGGNSIIIRHSSGMYSLYAHLKPHSIKVKIGDKVKVGQKIAKMGDTGNSDGMHLHFEAGFTIPLAGGIGRPLGNVAKFNGVNLTDYADLFFPTVNTNIPKLVQLAKGPGTLEGKLPNFFSINQ